MGVSCHLQKRTEEDNVVAMEARGAGDKRTGLGVRGPSDAVAASSV
jgi:hypothetical protein